MSKDFNPGNLIGVIHSGAIPPCMITLDRDDFVRLGQWLSFRLHYEPKIFFDGRCIVILDGSHGDVILKPGLSSPSLNLIVSREETPQPVDLTAEYPPDDHQRHLALAMEHEAAKFADTCDCGANTVNVPHASWCSTNQ